MIPNINVNLSREELADGSMLRNAIHEFTQEQDAAHFLYILEIMRDSNIWIPCNMIMSDTDYSNIEQLVNQAVEKDDLNSLIGSNSLIRMQSGWFPIFLSTTESISFLSSQARRKWASTECIFRKSSAISWMRLPCPFTTQKTSSASWSMPLQRPLFWIAGFSK